MNNDRTPRDTDELMEEVYFKDQSVKSRLSGLETSDDNMRELIGYNAERLKNMESESRWARKLMLTGFLTLLGLLVTITIKLFLI